MYQMKTGRVDCYVDKYVIIMLLSEFAVWCTCHARAQYYE